MAHLNVEQAAKRLRVSEQWVRKLLARGLIASAEKVGKLWLIPDPPVRLDSPKVGRPRKEVAK